MISGGILCSSALPCSVCGICAGSVPSTMQLIVWQRHSGGGALHQGCVEVHGALTMLLMMRQGWIDVIQSLIMSFMMRKAPCV